jgi:hypothetical protein
LTVLEQDATYQPPDEADAAAWAASYGLDPARVLYDADNTWAAQAVPVAYPVIYAVHTSNMLIWAAYTGWYSSEGSDWAPFTEWWVELLDECAAQPDAIDG